MSKENTQLSEKIADYQQVLMNTTVFRKAWTDSIKGMIRKTLQDFLGGSGLNGKLVENTDMENLESITLDLGRSSSGIAQSKETAEIKNFMIKNNGGLIYQQLFNGKIMAMVNQPHIEGYGERKEPQFVEIVTTEEINEVLILEHVEIMLEILTQWEDFDDEGPQKKTVFNPIGFQHSVNPDDAH